MTVGTGAYTVCMSKFEYADDAALIDEDAKQATARVTSLAIGSLEDAAMIISENITVLLNEFNCI